MTGDTLYSASDLAGKYSPTISPGDFCADFPNVGVVFSLTFSEENTVKDAVLAELLLRGESGEEFFVSAEGKFMPPTRGLTGQYIPSRIYLLILQQDAVSAAFLRTSKIEIRCIRTAGTNTKFDNFRVWH